MANPFIIGLIQSCNGEVSIKSMVKGISASIYEKSVVASKGDKFKTIASEAT